MNLEFIVSCLLEMNPRRSLSCPYIPLSPRISCDPQSDIFKTQLPLGACALDQAFLYFESSDVVKDILNYIICL